MSKCLGKTHGKPDQKYRASLVQQEEETERGFRCEGSDREQQNESLGRCKKKCSGKKDQKRLCEWVAVCVHCPLTAGAKTITYGLFEQP